MDLEETDARNDCVGEGQHQFNRPTELIAGHLLCGGGFEYLHGNPGSRRRRRIWKPVPGDITGLPSFWGI
jgi:hypothetical protein